MFHIHGHSPRRALVAGGLAFAAAVAIFVAVPSHPSVASAGAAFFVLLAVKHLALVATVGLPATAGLRRFRRRTRREPVPLRAGADGYFRTGEAEPHRGVFRLEHDVRTLPGAQTRQALVELEADKRMMLRFLDDLDGDALRAGLCQRYAKRGFRDATAVERWLSPVAGPIARGESLAICYDAGSHTTRVEFRAASAVVAGTDFMRATWRLWFDDAAPSSLADALMRNLRGVTG